MRLHGAGSKLSLCNMKTLYLRNVPDHVADNLSLLAEREGMSLNAFAVRELDRLSRRAHNAALFADLPDLEITTEQILSAIDEGRKER